MYPQKTATQISQIDFDIIKTNLFFNARAIVFDDFQLTSLRPIAKKCVRENLINSAEIFRQPVESSGRDEVCRREIYGIPKCCFQIQDDTFPQLPFAATGGWEKVERVSFSNLQKFIPIYIGNKLSHANFANPIALVEL